MDRCIAIDHTDFYKKERTNRQIQRTLGSKKCTKEYNNRRLCVHYKLGKMSRATIGTRVCRVNS
jgi:hypothetical protein